MSKSFSVSPRLLARAPRLGVPLNLPLNLKDPRVLVRLALGVLIVANIAAALMAFKPWGGSAEDLAREQVNLQQQLTSLQGRLERTKVLVSKAEHARQEGDGFLAEYTADRRTTFSTIFEELDRIAREAGIQQRPVSYDLTPVEGSDSLQQMAISAAYEGTYTSLTKFINLLDKSPRFLIIESLIAAPQQSSAADLLSVTIKVDTFVHGDAGSPI